MSPPMANEAADLARLGSSIHRLHEQKLLDYPPVDETRVDSVGDVQALLNYRGGSCSDLLRPFTLAAIRRLPPKRTHTRHREK
jgi:hypothetical protein